MVGRRQRRRRRRQRGGINPAVIAAGRKVAKLGMKYGVPAAKKAAKYRLPLVAPYLAHKGINLMNKRLQRW